MSCRANGYEVCGDFPSENASMYPLHKVADVSVSPRLSSNSNEVDIILSDSSSGSGVVVRLRIGIIRGLCA